MSQWISVKGGWLGKEVKTLELSVEAVPRVGERLQVNGESLPVVDVFHVVSDEGPFIKHISVVAQERKAQQ
jgi:hypothetical protein